MVRQARAQDAYLTGPGDMDQVRLETLEHFADQRNVAEERRIKAQILFENEGKKAARQFQCPNVALFHHRPGAVTGTHAKEG